MTVAVGGAATNFRISEPGTAAFKLATISDADAGRADHTRSGAGAQLCSGTDEAVKEAEEEEDAVAGRPLMALHVGAAAQAAAGGGTARRGERGPCAGGGRKCSGTCLNCTLLPGRVLLVLLVGPERDQS